MSLTDDQLRKLEITERCASVLSVLSIATILGTYRFSHHFRNPIHRLIFINTFYNVFDVTATFISVSGPKAGNSSALCQFQGFLLQMFPLADVLWTLAMALDVLLIVFYRHDAETLRKLEIKYIGIITTVVFIPALTFLFIHTPEKGHMYGSQKIWCSISPNWLIFRIIFYYGPIWVIIVITTVLYCVVGVKLFKNRDMFNAIANDSVSIHRQSHSFRQYILMPLMIFAAELAVWVAPTTNRIVSFIDPSYESYPLLMAVALTGSLRGFWNGVFFVAIGMKSRSRQKELDETILLA
ncbi:hypothetical protein OIDMADRAFT_133399 [Oidiodendron maius Zn]|uniref:G-protein coupled receptors family 2 profile 2 domain-containing protein n=1 Tax=Oidiodendron maius (strain Zn) TaxID=913774 RepID=A0A0C3CA24_OIDMZ|nr:hypothetical protein OIDMADRAFT_133399 [Oidiodendron maius Zn]